MRPNILRTLLTSMTFLIALGLVAQKNASKSDGEKEESVKIVTDKVADHLHLSTSQRKKVKEINMEHNETVHQAMKMEDEEKKRKAIREADLKMEKQYEKVLSPEQMKKFRKGKWNERLHKAPPPKAEKNIKAPQRKKVIEAVEEVDHKLNQELDLEEETKKKVHRVNKKYVGELIRIRDARISSEKRKQKKDDVHKTWANEMKELLTPDQFEQFEEMKPHLVPKK